jgi:perosamine synthetase
MFVPVSRPLIDESDVTAVAEAVRRGDISGLGGPELKAFEEQFAAFCGVSYGVATTSCYTALHLAMATLGIGPDDEVIVQSFTNMSTFFPVVYLGATPIAVDSESDTWNIDTSLIEEKITPKTKAIVVVHIYGHPVDMDPVMEIARKHNLYVVEDVAEAFGGEYKGKILGSIGDAGCFSFLANKFITTGEGGMITLKDQKLYERAKMLRSLAFGTDNKFMHRDFGFNYRMTNMQAALGVSQLKKVKTIIDKKRSIAAYYLNAFKDIRDVQLPIEKEYAKNVYWMFHMVLQGKLLGKRKTVMAALKEKGVDTRESFIPFNEQEIFIKKGLARADECPVANNIGENGLYIPSGPNISDEELAHVANQFVEVVNSLIS